MSADFQSGSVVAVSGGTRGDDCVECRRGRLQLKSFPLQAADCRFDVDLAWQDWGDRDQPVAVVLGGISAGLDVADWWSGLCGPGLALDPQRMRLLSIDWVGGAGASTGPLDGDTLPAVDTLDQARALLALTNHLGIRKVAVVIGASYGGCVAQHLAVLLQSRLGHLVVIGAAHRPSPWALGLRTLQRAGITAAKTPEDRVLALARARQIAVLGYRTPDELEQRFGDVVAERGVLSWLDGHGRRFVARFSAEAFLCLSSSLDAHRIDPTSITVATTVLAFDGDLIAPPCLLQDFANRIGATAQFLRLPSRCGHDAFLKETSAVSEVLTPIIEGACA